MNFLITQKEKGGVKSWLWLTFAFLFFYILLGYSKNLIFHLSDDAYVILLAKSGEFHTPDTHSMLGWLLKTAYSWHPEFFWYDSSIVLFYMLGISRILFVFNTYAKRSFATFILLISCILLGFLPFQPNFTILSMFLTVAAILPCFIGASEGVSIFTRKNLAITVLFVLLACLYRSPAVFLTAGCALTILSALILYERSIKRNRERTISFLKPAALMSGIMAFALFMSFLNIYMYKVDPEYQRVIEYDAYRRGFVDYFRYSYDQSYPAYDISLNDFNLMRHFMGIDSPPLHLENLKALPQVSIFNTRRMTYGFLRALNCLKHSCALMLILILLVISIFSRRAQICAAIPIFLIFLIGIITCRMHLRVCLPLLSFGVLTGLIFISSKPQNHSMPKRFFYFNFFVILLAVMAITVAAGYQQKKVSQYKNDLKSAARLWAFCDKFQINNIAYWPLAATFDNWILFSSAPLPESIKLNRIGGWAGSYPKTIKKLQMIYGQDIYKGLAKPGTFHVVMNHSISAPYFETFIREHGPDQALPTVVFKTKRTLLYLVSTAPR